MRFDRPRFFIAGWQRCACWGSITGAGDGAHESGMEFKNLSGTSAITGSDISFSQTNAVDIVNTDVNLTLSIANSKLRDSQTDFSGGPTNGIGEGGFQFRSFSVNPGSPTTNIDITGNTIDSEYGTAVAPSGATCQVPANPEP
jgi:hypothetical protein